MTPDQIMKRLGDIEADLADRTQKLETAADEWFKAKRDREHKRAKAFLETKASGTTVAEAEATADRDTCLIGLDAEARYEALKAVVRVLETRASIGQSLLRAHTAAGWSQGQQPQWTGRQAA